MVSVYGYTRISRMAEPSENSIEKQEQAIRKYAEHLNYAVNRFFNERSVSGGVPLLSRPIAQKLLSELNKGDIIIVASFNRLFRSVLDARNSLRALKKKGVQIHAIDLDGDILGTDLYSMLTVVTDAFAPTEAEHHAQKIRDAKAALREKGKFQGGKVDFGYRVANDGRLVEDDHAQEALVLMKKLRKSGTSYRAISEEIEKKFKKFDLKISHEGVRRILSRNGS